MNIRLVFAHALDVRARQTRFDRLLAQKLNCLSHPHYIAVLVFTLGRNMLQPVRQFGYALLKHLVHLDLEKRESKKRIIILNWLD